MEEDGFVSKWLKQLDKTRRDGIWRKATTILLVHDGGAVPGLSTSDHRLENMGSTSFHNRMMAEILRDNWDEIVEWRNSTTVDAR